jgi:hypothetical protein
MKKIKMEHGAKRVSLLEFIGKKFGKENQLTVVSRLEDKSKTPMFLVHCSVCAKDKELFGDGTFCMSKGNLNKGAIPCGCGNYQYGREQSLVRVKRKLIDKKYNLEVIDIDGKWKGTDTKLLLKCKIHGTEWNTVGVHTFLGNRYKGMCIDCEKGFISTMKTSDDQSVIDAVTSSGRFPKGTVFWRTPEKKNKDKFGRLSGNRWAIMCGICSYDKFVEQSLCEGIFYTTADSLQAGNRPCRCSVHFKYTVEQRGLQIEDSLHTEGKYQFVGFHSANKWNHTSKLKFLCHCPDHGIFNSSVSSMTGRGIKCVNCSEGGGFKTSKLGSVYVLDIRGERGGFTGYGISNVVDDRIRTHSSELSKFGFTIFEKQVFNFSGKMALLIESKLKSKFELNPQDITGFRVEATHSNLYKSVVEFVNSFTNS